MTFDYVVANPPFSDKRWSNGVNTEKDPYERFKSFGTPPGKQGDYAYLLHIIRSLKSTGKGACILPHGVLFRGNAEADIRRKLIRQGYIKGIIGLPANLFYGTGIPACIVVIDKQESQARKGIFMIDAAQGFMKDGPKNRLRAQDIHKIVDAFTNQVEIPGFSKIVPYELIEKNDYNLNLPRYIESQKVEDQQDIEGHLRGGIPKADIDALQAYWDMCPSLKGSLFVESRSNYFDLKVDKAAIKASIYDHPEFSSFITGMNAHFMQWRETVSPTLKSLKVGYHPKNEIFTLSEGLLAHYADKPLVSKYDVYQHIMDYWADVMQDDCYLIAADGWKAETYRLIVKDKKGKERDKGWICDLIPKSLIVKRFFADEQAEIDRLSAELEAVTAELAEFEEEHASDEGYLSDLEKINKACVKARLKELKKEKDAKDEVAILNAWEKLSDKQADLKAKLKEADTALDAAAYAKYPHLTEAEIKTLVVEDKWLDTLDAAIHGEMDRISQTLTQRVRTLAERYATPMPKLVERTHELEAKVTAHLKKMGYAW